MQTLTSNSIGIRLLVGGNRVYCTSDTIVFKQIGDRMLRKLSPLIYVSQG